MLESMIALGAINQLHDPPVDKLHYFYRSKYMKERRKRIALNNLKLSGNNRTANNAKQEKDD